MSVKDELRIVIDQLKEDHAAEVLAFARRLLVDDGAPGTAARARLARRMEPPVVPGSAFFQQPTHDLPTIAAQQGVTRTASFEDLLGDDWPDDEPADEFVATIRQWRREGGYA